MKKNNKVAVSGAIDKGSVADNDTEVFQERFPVESGNPDLTAMLARAFHNRGSIAEWYAWQPSR